jgi:hypothetical protein
MSFLGLAAFLFFGGMAFWMLVFMLGFILPYWITLGVFQQLQPKRIFEDKEEEEAEA